MKITDFYNKDYLFSSLYQSFRSIASYVDGCKPSGRKVIYTVDKKNITSKIKVSQLQSDVAKETDYLHGDQSLYGVIVGLAINYIGTNNVNVLEPKGNFGSRFINESAANRYIYTHKSNNFDLVFNKEDSNILPTQIFENNQIEYRYYVPVIPLMLVNGNEGIGSGYAQLILGRNLEDIKREIKNYLNGKTMNNINPFYKGFKGKIKRNGLQVIMEGKIERINLSTIKIVEIPLGYDLKKYIKILEDLIDNKVIKSYKDNSENDNFEFIVSVTEVFGKQDDDKILNDLKLIGRLTENFTCIDEENKVIEFIDEVDLLKKYCDIRLKYYNLRKEYIINKINGELKILNSKFKFIQNIIDKKIEINNKKKDDIVNQIKLVKDILRIDDSYDYLLRIPIWNLTEEKIEELKKEIVKKTTDLEIISKKDVKQMWIEELDKIK